MYLVTAGQLDVEAHHEGSVSITAVACVSSAVDERKMLPRPVTNLRSDDFCFIGAGFVADGVDAMGCTCCLAGLLSALTLSACHQVGRAAAAAATAGLVLLAAEATRHATELRLDPA